MICHIFQRVCLQCLFHSSLGIPQGCLHGFHDIPPNRAVGIGIRMKVKERRIRFFLYSQINLPQCNFCCRFCKMAAWDTVLRFNKSCPLQGGH